MSFDSDHDDDAEIIAEGPTSIVTRIESETSDGPRLIAVKSSTTTHAKEPHDIVKEVRLLASLSHPNIIPLLKQEMSPTSRNLSFWMPFIPYSLDVLFRSSRFSPHPIISFESSSISSPTPREVQFIVLTKSIIFQVLSGMSYLHGENVRIAHRDIKPSNILLTPSGCVQLIDFGIAFPVCEDDTTKARDLWPEFVSRMYFEVSTGPYRAPELLFGSRTYDAFAIDAWSLGATFAEFFTALRLQTGDEEDEEILFDPPQSGSGSQSSTEPCPLAPSTPFLIPRRTRPGMPTGRWSRTNLFDGTRGEIALVWSIFKIRGTPNKNIWPSFLTLPDSAKLSFVEVDAVDLSSCLPNLPPSTMGIPLDTKTHAPTLDQIPSPLDLIHRFLVYEPTRRLQPCVALRHPWFTAKPGLILPMTDHVAHSTWPTGVGTVSYTFTSEGETHTLGDLLLVYVGNSV